MGEEVPAGICPGNGQDDPCRPGSGDQPEDLFGVGQPTVGSSGDEVEDHAGEHHRNPEHNPCGPVRRQEECCFFGRVLAYEHPRQGYRSTVLGGSARVRLDGRPRSSGPITEPDQYPHQQDSCVDGPEGLGERADSEVWQVRAGVDAECFPGDHDQEQDPPWSGAGQGRSQPTPSRSRPPMFGRSEVDRRPPPTSAVPHQQVDDHNSKQ
jgi:hypothetical protein